MRMIASALAGVLMTVLTVSGADAGSRSPQEDDGVAAGFGQVTVLTPWKQVSKVPLRFPTYHPQGFALVGDLIFMSTVEVTEEPKKYVLPVDGYDRTPGKGFGHVLVLDRAGKQLADIKVGEGTTYHPGGIDYDGTNVWVPVGEYRPNSKSIVYTIDPITHQVTEKFRVNDHIGGVVRDRATGHVHGMNWGSRKFFNWTDTGTQVAVNTNPNLLIDYQDCAYVTERKQLCSGMGSLPVLGSIALLDLADKDRNLKELPFLHYSTAGRVVTRNPLAFEVTGKTARIIAAPDNQNEGNGTELLTYEAPLS